MKLSDLLFAQSRDAERLVGVGLPICEEDENPGFEEETRAANELLEVDDDITAQLQAAVGPYVPPDGSEVMNRAGLLE